MSYGLKGQPAAVIIRETFVAWFQILGELERDDLDGLRVAWGRVKSKQTLPTCKVTGIMSNIIRIIQIVEWAPHTFNYWESRGGDKWVLRSFQDSPLPIINDLIHDYIKIGDKKASHHYCGGRNGRRYCVGRVLAPP